MSLEGRRVRLRAVEEGDLPLLHAWANDQALWSHLGGWRLPSSLDSAKAWFSGLKSDADNLRLVIEPLAGGPPVGTANLVGLDWKNRHAEHGLMLAGAETRRQGYGRDTVEAVMRYAFQELGLHRLHTDIIENNAASHALFTDACGWVVEGRQADWHYRQGRYWDRVLVGITADQYQTHLTSSGYWL